MGQPKTQSNRTLSISVCKDQQIDRFHRIKRQVADDRGVSPDDLTHTDILDELIEKYGFRRLEEDQRIREARHAVADDHNMSADDVSLRSLLKVTSGAYLGYQQTSDWEQTDDD